MNYAHDFIIFKPLIFTRFILFRLINTMKPGSVKKIQTSSMAFKCMENINGFVTGAKACGVSDMECFQTVDLWERQNLNSVVICLQSLGRKVNYHLEI